MKCRKSLMLVTGAVLLGGMSTVALAQDGMRNGADRGTGLPLGQTYGEHPMQRGIGGTNTGQGVLYLGNTERARRDGRYNEDHRQGHEGGDSQGHADQQDGYRNRYRNQYRHEYRDEHRSEDRGDRADDHHEDEHGDREHRGGDREDD